MSRELLINSEYRYFVIIGSEVLDGASEGGPKKDCLG